MQRISYGCSILIGLWSLVLGTSAAAQAPLMASARAIRIASSYCNAVGIAITSPPVCTFPAHQVGARSYWQPLWSVSFAGQAEVEVADRTGIVTGFVDTSLDRELGKQPAGTAISEAQAIGRATNALSATGQAGELAYWGAALTLNSDPPVAAAHTWTVTWQRECQGIPYLDDHATVMIQAETGRVSRLLIMFPSVPLQAARLTLPRNRAAAIAAASLKQAGVSDAVFTSARAVIVKTDQSWRSAAASPPHAVPVWMCSFQRLKGKADNMTSVVWVDNVGAVVGSQTVELANTRPAKTQRPAGPSRKDIHAHHRGRSG